MSTKLFRPLTMVASRLGFIAQKYSPELLTGAGIAGGVVATVIACKATLKLDQELIPVQDEIDDIKADRSNEIDDTRKYGRELTRAYSKGAAKVVRHYALPIAIGGASIAAILVGHGILHKRNAALVAAYNAVELAYASYRERVREEFGDEKDREILTRSRNELVKKDGMEPKKSKKSLDDGLPSGHARFFDRYNANYNNAQKDMNVYFLRTQQTYLNDMLRSKGHVTLNEVYRALGFEDTNEGMILGWVIKKDNHNFIDFGIWDANSDRARAFVNHDEDAILLDFNIDGVIWDQI